MPSPRPAECRWDQPHHRHARDRYSIPDWFARIWVEERWGPYDEHKALNPALSYTVIEISYAHSKGRCYQIREYCVYDYVDTVRTGTLRFLLRVDLAELRKAEIFAMRFLADATLSALANHHDPTSGVLSGLADIGLIASGLGLPPIIGDLVSGWDMGKLLDNIADIADKVKARLEEIDRLRELDGALVAEYSPVVWSRRTDRIKSFSSVEIVEVECADWILEIPEGEARRERGHDERIYPSVPLDEEFERELQDLRELAAPGGEAPVGGLEKIKSAIDRLRSRQQKR